MTHDLGRFIEAQRAVYPAVLRELHSGKKVTHWMWYIFPQITGLGKSTTAQYYAIQNLEHAQAYLAHPLLGARIQECTTAMMAHENLSATDIFGAIDSVKYHSSMTLFAHISGPRSVFQQALVRHFEGRVDHKTLEIVARR